MHVLRQQANSIYEVYKTVGVISGRSLLRSIILAGTGLAAELSEKNVTDEKEASEGVYKASCVVCGVRCQRTYYIGRCESG